MPYFSVAISLRPQLLKPILKQAGTVASPPKHVCFQLDSAMSTVTTVGPSIRGAIDSGASTHCLPYSYQGGAHQDVKPSNSVDVICANNSIIKSAAIDLRDGICHGTQLVTVVIFVCLSALIISSLTFQRGDTLL